jgi:predicted unusual protein kinase regulating ubiquinone biosynthesis (AarF/ABC1/UbiB family)
MYFPLLKTAFLRLQYRYFPNYAQNYWAQELLEAQGISAKLGQVFTQGKKRKLPKSSLAAKEAEKIFKETFSTHDQISFKNEAIAASIGQVFFITMGDQQLAVKFLHPKIKEKLKKEIANIVLLGSHYSKVKGFGFNKDNYTRFLEEVFTEETDLSREASYQDSFRNHFENDKRFIIPKVLQDFSNAEILTQEWVESTLAQDLSSIQHFHVLEFFFESLLKHGVLHGDLNDRNWGITADGTLVVYDYGCSQIVSARRTNGLIKLLNGQYSLENFLEFGIRLEATPFKNKVEQLGRALFSPFSAKTLMIHEWSFAESLNKEFGKDIKLLREYTDPWVLLMMRSLYSILKTYEKLKVPIPFMEILNPLLKIKDEAMSSKNVKIEVKENMQLSFSMELPLASLDNLATYMPSHVQEKLKERNIDLEQTLQKIRMSNYTPQEIFQIDDGIKKYRVWIE